MEIKKLILMLSCLLGLTPPVFAADNPATGKSDLSTTATEFYQIRSQKFGGLLRPEGANGAVGTRIVLYPAEPWKCMTWKLQPAGDSGFHIQNHFTAKTFSTQDGNNNVIQIALAHEADECPVWRFTRLPDGSYQISDVKSGDALTAISEGGGSKRIVVATWQAKDEQKWELEKIDPANLTM